MIWITDVDFEVGYGTCQVIRASKPWHLCPRKFDPRSIKDDQHVIDMEAVLTKLAEEINKLGRPVHHVGFATFGNVDVENRNFTYRVMDSGKDLVPICAPQRIEDLTGVPATEVIVANDATAAAVGEWAHGSGKGKADFAYIWAGRGINIGLILGHEPWQGRLHPEAGHVLVRRHDSEPENEGICPDHNGCVLGLACIRAITMRLDNNTMSLEDASDLMGYYYAQLCLAVTFMVAPERVAMGGLLMSRYALPGLLENTRTHFKKLKGRYPAYQILSQDNFIEAATAPCASLWGLVEMMRQRLEKVR